MISILIPVFNKDVNQLAIALSAQLTAVKEKGEIIVMDDGSEPSVAEANSKLNNLPFVRYIPSEKNYGRLLIRRRLADEAVFDWLLFLDCDSKIVSPDYIANYLQSLSSGADVIVGGRVYQPMPPADCRYRLHWKYGRARETKNRAKKGLRGYEGFMSNNFLIQKKKFLLLSVEITSWNGYGHEDTLMGIQLENRKLPVLRIDNAVLHDGIEEATVFIRKSENALQNLQVLSDITDHHILKKHVKLYRYFCYAKSLGLLWAVRLLYRAIPSFIVKNLQSCNPSLLLFDLYRLNYFIVWQSKIKQGYK